MSRRLALNEAADAYANESAANRYAAGHKAELPVRVAVELRRGMTRHLSYGPHRKRIGGRLGGIVLFRLLVDGDQRVSHFGRILEIEAIGHIRSSFVHGTDFYRTRRRARVTFGHVRR